MTVNGIKSVTNIFAGAQSNIFNEETGAKKHVQYWQESCSMPIVRFSPTLSRTCVRIKSVSFFCHLPLLLSTCPCPPTVYMPISMGTMMISHIFFPSGSVLNIVWGVKRDQCSATGPVNELLFSVEILLRQRKILFNFDSRWEQKIK